MKRKILIMINILLVIRNVSSQTCPDIPNGKLELVRNGSFEEYSEKPWVAGQLQFAKNWLQLPNNASTADYRHQDFNDCDQTPTGQSFVDCKSMVSLQSNGDFSINGFSHNQKPKSGKGFAMILAGIENISTIGNCSETGNVGGEYIIQELAQPLMAGKTYTAKFYACLVESSKYATKDLSIFFTKDLPKTNSIYCPITTNVSAKVVKTGAITDINNWTEVSGTFVANGGEKFLTIGVINPSISKFTQNTVGISPQLQSAYYMIDDVSVTLDICSLPEFNNASPMLIQACSSCQPKHFPPDNEYQNVCIATSTPWSVKIFNATHYKLTVINRWNNKVCRDEGFDPCGFDGKVVYWDGRTKNALTPFPTADGQTLGNDLYYYSLEISNCNETFVKEGEIYLYQGQDIPVVAPYICSCPLSIRAFFPPGNFSCESGHYVSYKNINTPLTKQASIIVQSNNTTINHVTELTEFTAGYQIELGTNFQVNLGSQFNAKIENCNISVSALKSNSQTNIHKSSKEYENININKGNIEINENRNNTLQGETNIITTSFLIYPNPTNGNSIINYSLEENSDITIVLYDYTGHKIMDIEKNKNCERGIYQKQIDLKHLKQGYYLITLFTKQYNRAIKFSKID